MRSDYKKLGSYIREVSDKNKELIDLPLLGVSIQKEFIPSIANTIGTDMSNYKIVKRGQFAYGPVTSRNGDKISIALLESYDEVLISQSYKSFEIVDHNELLPEYLMMWFRRPEFDRYARYMSHGSTRETFDWDEMCNTELPVPSIEKQREIVKEYKVLQDRISLNNTLIEKLEDTAQTIYKQWFVDFEFPNENGKPYKFNNGEMEYREELNDKIPSGWEVGTIDKLVEIIDGDRGKNYPSKEEMHKEGYCLFLNAGNVTTRGFDFTENIFITKEKDNELRKGKLVRNDIVITSRGTVGNVGYYSNIIEYDNIRINSGMVILRSINDSNNTSFIYSMLKSNEMKITIKNFLSGSAQQQLPIKDLVKIQIIIPENKIIKKYHKISMRFQNRVDATKLQNDRLMKFSEILLSKLATVEG